jgi:hypothetical protein
MCALGMEKMPHYQIVLIPSSLLSWKKEMLWIILLLGASVPHSQQIIPPSHYCSLKILRAATFVTRTFYCSHQVSPVYCVRRCGRCVQPPPSIVPDAAAAACSSAASSVYCVKRWGRCVQPPRLLRQTLRPLRAAVVKFTCTSRSITLHFNCDVLLRLTHHLLRITDAHLTTLRENTWRRIWGSQSGGYEKYHLLGYNAV